MSLAKTAGAITTAVTGSKAAGSIIKSLISSSANARSSTDINTTNSSTQAAVPKSEAILELMFSNKVSNPQKLVSNAVQDTVQWYAQKNRESQAALAGYGIKQQTAGMIGGAFAAAGQGLSQLFGKKGGGSGGKGGDDGDGGGRAFASANGGGQGGGGCANGQCGRNVASTDAWKGADPSIKTAQAIQDATQPQALDSSSQQQFAQLDQAKIDQQAQQQEPPPPPPEPMVSGGTPFV